MDAFQQLGNLSWEDSRELLDLDQSIYMPPDVVDNVIKMKNRSDISHTQHVSSQEVTFTARKHKTNMKLSNVSVWTNKKPPRTTSEI